MHWDIMKLRPGFAKTVATRASIGISYGPIASMKAATRLCQKQETSSQILAYLQEQLLKNPGNVACLMMASWNMKKMVLRLCP